MYADQQRVVHDLESLQQAHISLYLTEKDMFLARPEFEMEIPSEPIEILSRRSRILREILLLEISTDRRSLEVESPMDISMRGKQIIHHDKVNFLSVRYLHSMQTVELREQGVRILLDVLVVFA